jgi:hypothetical protein
MRSSLGKKHDDIPVFTGNTLSHRTTKYINLIFILRGMSVKGMVAVIPHARSLIV